MVLDLIVAVCFVYYDNFRLEKILNATTYCERSLLIPLLLAAELYTWQFLFRNKPLR